MSPLAGLAGSKSSSPRKASTCIALEKADTYPCLEWASNPRFQWSNFQCLTCLRPRGHCDRLTSKFFFDPGVGRFRIAGHRFSVFIKLSFSAAVPVD